MGAIDHKRAKLQAAADYIGVQLRARIPAETIILGLVEHHGARHRAAWNVSTLRCAGVASSCTYSAGKALLDNWRKTATVRLMSFPRAPF